jgi:hypothetical protein
MTSPNEITAWGLLTATAGLLAFLVALYTLVGRERKSPYLINSIFSVFIICLFGAIFDLLALVAPIQEQSFWFITYGQKPLLKVGLCFLLLAFFVAIWKVWTVSIRLSRFVDPSGPFSRLRYLTFVQWIKNVMRKQDGRHTYQHHPEVLTEQLKDDIQAIVRQAAPNLQTDGAANDRAFEIRAASEKRSLALALRHQGQSNEILSQLAIKFLSAGFAVQYMTSSRHPIEFIEHLKANFPAVDEDNGWRSIQKLIVVVDAYTPHFGFMDSINSVKTDQLRGAAFGVECLSSPVTYAGLHTASSQAFKAIKKVTAGPNRKPALVIYEDCYALADLESVEQYRIFVRHVLPSERLWDGMFTVFAETAPPEGEWALVSSYASMMLDMRSHWPQDENAA